MVQYYSVASRSRHPRQGDSQFQSYLDTRGFSSRAAIKCGVHVSGSAAGQSHKQRMKSLWHLGYFCLDRPRKCCPYNTQIVQGTPDVYFLTFRTVF